MLQKFVKTFGGDPNKREIEKTTDFVVQINALEAEIDRLVYGLSPAGMIYGLTEEEIGIMEQR